LDSPDAPSAEIELHYALNWDFADPAQQDFSPPTGLGDSAAFRRLLL
jgi:hypothetical protein